MSCEKHKAGLAVDCIKLEQTPIEKAIWSVLDEYCDAENHPLKEYDLVCDVLQKVEEAVSKCTFTGWIPCIARLPEPNKAVLVSTNTGEVDVDYYGKMLKDFIGLKGTHMKAIAWMPLPPAYKEDKE